MCQLTQPVFGRKAFVKTKIGLWLTFYLQLKCVQLQGVTKFVWFVGACLPFIQYHNVYNLFSRIRTIFEYQNLLSPQVNKLTFLASRAIPNMAKNKAKWSLFITIAFATILLRPQNYICTPKCGQQPLVAMACSLSYPSFFGAQACHCNKSSLKSRWTMWRPLKWRYKVRRRYLDWQAYVSPYKTNVR